MISLSSNRFKPKCFNDIISNVNKKPLSTIASAISIDFDFSNLK